MSLLIILITLLYHITLVIVVCDNVLYYATKRSQKTMGHVLTVASSIPV